MTAAKLQWAAFPTCAFQPELPEGERLFKPQRLLGSVLQLHKMSAACTCRQGRGHVHVGLTNSKEAAEYPKAMCELMAELIAAHFEKMAYMEWLRIRKDKLTKEIADLQSGVSKASKRPMPMDTFAAPCTKKAKSSTEQEPNSSRRTSAAKSSTEQSAKRQKLILTTTTCPKSTEPEPWVGGAGAYGT